MIKLANRPATETNTSYLHQRLTCRIFTSFTGLDHLRDSWDMACLRVDSSVYMTYDWVRVWWKFYGGRSELRLFIFFLHDNIEAVVPLYIDTLGRPLLRFRVARLVGANIPPKVFDPPIPKSCSTEVLGYIVDQLFVEDACDLLSFGPISELQPIMKCLETVCLQRARLVRQRKALKGVYSVFHVPQTMEEYFDSLSKNERKNRRKYELRLLRKEYETEVDVVSATEAVSQEFERFAEQHKLQWLAEGKSGHFGAWPYALEYNRALVKAQSEQNRVRFIRISANGEIIANQYTFVFGDRYFWELPSRAVAQKWERFSLGPTGIVTMLNQAVKERIRNIQAGLAHYDYKVRLGAKEYETLTFRIGKAMFSARARFLVFSLVRYLYIYAYHKLWYRRIMPRLPRIFWQAQSKRWLRLDF